MVAKRKTTRQKKESPDATELLVIELQQIHSAETQLSRVLPRIAKAVDSDAVRKRLEDRLSQGDRLLQEVEGALEELDVSPGRKKNVAAEGLINDVREHIQEIEAGPALDAVLIAGIQKTEHYCIAAWGTAKALGQATSQKTVVKAMEQALKEGKAYDEDLTQLAEREIMPAMMTQASETGEEEDTDSSAPRSRQSKNGGAERHA
jgi:ferritin-like metal-binding protein YciE